MHPRITLSVTNFFFGFSVAIVVYVLLPYLANFMPVQYTGLVIAAGAALASGAFFALPKLVARIGAQQAAILLTVAQMFVLFALAAGPNKFAVVPLVALAVALQPFLGYTLDLLLEATVKEETVTGRVRTLFLTAWNVAELGAPLVLGAVLDTSNAYGRVFLAAAVALIPVIVIFATRTLPAGKPPRLAHAKETFLTILHDRDLTAVSVGHLLLYLFYIWAPLYVPLYLHDTLHIPWSTLGWIFAIILLPFIFIEYPAGFIADNYLGDKELMVLGFVIMGSALAAVSLITSTSSIAFIVGILLLSRVGAALVESMTEAHFFRRVSETDIETIAFYRILWPLSGLIAPLIGSMLLFIDGFFALFLITGVLIGIIGVTAALSIRDFR
ncbi:MAG: hypothetical protein B7X04_01320 [Parcubacteria group bacterium 21-54-25]|nr:MAG: hypothetical protein B7X04_01320 [Parcubacteria group bacterium 21-54-25]HQU07571.1 MFS transporter [Candidatus Paceibacterota bacterium]